MYKKLLCLCVIFAGISYACSSVAAATVRKLGATTSTAAPKSTANNITRQVQVTKARTVPISQTATTGASAQPVTTGDRLSVVPINTVKSIKSVKQITTNGGGGSSSGGESPTPTTPDVSDEEFTEVKNKLDDVATQVENVSERVDTIETNITTIENNISNVSVNQGEGRYVTSVETEEGENSLQVTRTNSLYAPIRNVGEDTEIGIAEIWVEP